MRPIRAVAAAVVVTVSIAVGCLVALASTRLLLAALLVPVSVLAVTASRRRVGAGRGERASVEVVARDDQQHASARLLYYAGLASMTWLQLRFGPFTLSDYAFLASLTLVLFEAVTARGHRWPRLPPLLLAGILAFAAGGLLSTLASSDSPLASLGILGRVLYLLVAWFLLGATVLRTPRHLRIAVACWVFSAAVCGLWALAQKAGIVAIPGAAGGGRPSGLSDHANDLGALSAIALLPALAIAYDGRRVLGVLAVAAIGAGLVVSGSIGAAVAAGCALLVGSASRGLTRIALAGIAAGAAVISYAAATGSLGGSQFDRFGEVTNPNADFGAGTLQTRVELVERAWAHIQSHPWIGVGLDPHSSLVYTYTDGARHEVHNLFVEAWYEAGILGLLGVVLIVVATLRIGRQAALRSSALDHTLAVALLGASCAFVVMGMSEPLLYKRIALAPLALAFALATCQRPLPARTITQRPPPRYAGDERASNTQLVG